MLGQPIARVAQPVRELSQFNAVAQRLRTGRVEDWTARLLGLPQEGLRA